MAKSDDWRKKVDDWKGVLNQPKNAGLKAGGGTGISEAIRKVADAEMDLAKAQQPGKAGLTTAVADLMGALDELVNLCKKTSDKHKAVFTSACQHLDTLRAAALARRTEVGRELDEARNAIGDMCGVAIQHLRNARSIQELTTAWQNFVHNFETRAKGFPRLQANINSIKSHRAPAATGVVDQERPALLKLAQDCQRAAAAAR